MPESLRNPFRGEGLGLDVPLPASDPAPVAALLADCPRHQVTPLVAMSDLVPGTIVHVKDERGRMGLGSFKALGAAHVIARAADQAGGRLAGQSYVTASAGNHGLSVAAGAAVFGARAVIYLAETVPEAFAERLRAKGAEVRRAGATYEASMAAAEAAAASEGLELLSDSTWDENIAPGLGVMEGYLQMAAELVDQMDPPDTVYLQAGVGGLAAAVAAHLRVAWGDGPQIVVVEPAAAPALIESIRAGRPVTTEGPVSEMGRLDCKTPSLVALNGLSRDADLFVTVSEAEASAAVERLSAMPSTPSGLAGLAALLAGRPAPGARALVILSEGREDG